MSLVLRTKSGSIVPLDGNDPQIGSASGCDVRIDGPAVRPRHAEVRRLGDRWLVECRDDATIRVGDGAATKMAWLRAGDTIWIGDAGDYLVLEERTTPVIAPTDAVADVSAPVSTGPPQQPSASQSAPIAAHTPPREPPPVAASQSARAAPAAFDNRLLLFGAGGLAVVAIVVSVALAFRSPDESPGDETQKSGASGRRVAKDDPPVARPPADPTALLKAAATRVENAVVWIGVDIEGTRFALATGWAVSPTEVVTTAGQVVQFIEARKEIPNGRFFVFCPKRKPAIVYCGAKHVHRQYAQAAEDSDLQRHCDVGVLVLKEALPEHCQLSTESTGPTTDSVVGVLGYNIPAENHGKLTEKSRPTRVSTTATVRSAVLRESPDGRAVLQIETAAPLSSDGGVAFDVQGRAVGVCSVSGGARQFVVHRERIAELLKRVRSGALSSE